MAKKIKSEIEIITQAHQRLVTARQQANVLRKEIEQLRHYLRDAGENPDPPRFNVVPRNKEIFKKWKNGFHPRQIGAEFNLSPERVRQICLRIEKILEIKKYQFKEYKDLLKYSN